MYEQLLNNIHTFFICVVTSAPLQVPEVVKKCFDQATYFHEIMLFNRFMWKIYIARILLFVHQTYWNWCFNRNKAMLCRMTFATVVELKQSPFKSIWGFETRILARFLRNWEKYIYNKTLLEGNYSLMKFETCVDNVFVCQASSLTTASFGCMVNKKGICQTIKQWQLKVLIDWQQIAWGLTSYNDVSSWKCQSCSTCEIKIKENFPISNAF